MKKFTIILLPVILIIFSLFQFYKNTEYDVLRVISPTEIILDFNRNKRIDNNENIVLKNILSFSTKKDNSEVTAIYNLSNEDAMRLGFLAENFAKDKLEQKRVKVFKDEIYIDDKKYSDILLNSGFAVRKGEPFGQKLRSNLEKARKINLIILNNRNFKYHKLNCKFGLAAHNYEVIPKSQVPKEATPCKYCFVQKEKAPVKQEIIYKNLITKHHKFQMFLTDMTVNLKPSKDCTSTICKALVKEISSAQSTIDFAIYGYTKIPKVQKALEDAQKRGVKIRFVYDMDKKGNIYPDTFYLASLLKENNKDISPSIMHNKFFIFDGKKVFTGSTNLSNTDMSGFNSNSAILIESVEVAKMFEKEFNQMFNGNFHERKNKIAKSNDSNVRVFFSPQDKIITNQIIPLVNSAKNYIYIPTFLITHKEFAKSLIKAKNRGVDVKIILDSTNTRPPSQIDYLRAAKIPVKTENYAGKLHSKSMIVDDKYVIIGSMNFSRSGEDFNDENLLIIEDSELAKFYKNFFNYLWVKIPNIWLVRKARAESPDSIGSCNDGIDNDFDGKIDSQDEGCMLKKH